MIRKTDVVVCDYCGEECIKGSPGSKGLTFYGSAALEGDYEDIGLPTDTFLCLMCVKRRVTVAEFVHKAGVTLHRLREIEVARLLGVFALPENLPSPQDREDGSDDAFEAKLVEAMSKPIKVEDSAGSVAQQQ